jgi:hypothetical protein
MMKMEVPSSRKEFCLLAHSESEPTQYGQRTVDVEAKEGKTPVDTTTRSISYLITYACGNMMS